MIFPSTLKILLKGKGTKVHQRKGRVEGKVAIVTGAGAGLGKAIAEALAREGARVMLTDIDENSVATAASEIRDNDGIADFMHQDVTDEGQWKLVVAKTCKKFGGLNILVNNAGAAGLTDLDNFNSDDVRRIFAVNLEGTLFGIVSAIAVMKNSGGGSIVNVSSVGGIVALPGLAAYCASKGAVRLLTKSVALECAMKKNGVRVNSLHPGFVPTRSSLDDITQMTGLSSQGATDEIAATIPIGRAGTPEEIANGALFLASEESSFMTGSELVMDGGVSAG